MSSDGEPRALRVSPAFPELQLLVVGTALEVDDALTAPFAVDRAEAGAIRLSARFASDEVATAVMLRHAIEAVHLCRRLDTSRSSELLPVVAALAARTAGRYVQEQDRAAVARFGAVAPDWLLDAYAALAGSLAADLPVETWRRLIALIEPDASANAPTGGLVLPQLDLIETFSVPSEQLLTVGGDDRLEVDRETRLNLYGCSPRPRPHAITFASSTATSISDHAYCEVDAFRIATLAALVEGDGEWVPRAHEDARTVVLREMCDAPSDTDAILTTSGTDAELWVLHMALSGHERHLDSIVVGLEEMGSGMVFASSGRHFSSHTPLGVAVDMGRPVPGLASERISVIDVPVRAKDGSRRPSEEIDREVERLVRASITSGHRCLLHVIDQSKSGIRAPSERLVRGLEAEIEQLHVTVDACQGRLSPSLVRQHLDRGRVVVLTGSKFFTGPPFAGAIVVPGSWRTAGSDSLPAGFADYFSPNERPAAMRSGAELNARPNVGLLCRWVAASAEVQRFIRVPVEVRQRILAELSQFLRDSLERASFVQPLPFSLPDDLSAEGPSSQQTVFAFLPLVAGSPASWEQSHRIYEYLNRDISGELPADASEPQRRTARRECHIGQPMRLPDASWLLRLSVGARTVSPLRSFDERSIRERIDHQKEGISAALAKLELILELLG